MASQKMTKAEKSWIVYDVGNSALVLLATSVIPIYFSSLSPDGGVVVAWSYAETVASLIIALLMPVLGSIADMQGMKKKFIVGCVGTGVVATVALGFVTAALAFLIIYVISSVALNSSMVFYDALLVDTTTDDRMDEISSQGYAWGYIGSCVPFIACLGVVLGYEALGITLQTAMQIAFIITGVPLLKNVQQRHFKPREPHAVSRAIRGLAGTLREIWANRAIRYYMIAYFFYIDGVHTIIKLSTSYGTELGIDSTQLVLALLVTRSRPTLASPSSPRSSCARPPSSGSWPSSWACSRAASRRSRAASSASSAPRSAPTSTSASSTSLGSTPPFSARSSWARSPRSPATPASACSRSRCSSSERTA